MTPNPFRRFGVQALGAAALCMTTLLAACGSSSTTQVGAGTPTAIPCPSTKTLTGTGATFDNPLFQKMFQVYPTAKCGLNASYTATGSGTGQNQLLAQTVDFGATDGPMTDATLAKSTNGPIIHIPVTLGAVAMSYHLTGVTALTLDGTTIANIYLGKITNWNDPAIAVLNPNATLPNKAIAVAHRSDGSGTTAIFTNYLAAVSTDWANGPKAGTTINWPVGTGGNGSDGVTSIVKNTEGSIGYVELGYALANNISVASVKNAAGNAVAPSLDSVKAAAANFTNIPADLRFYIVNAPGADSYPISGYSWVIVYQNQTNADKGKALANLLWWMSHDGQQYSAALYYVPLPANIVTLVEGKIKSMQCGGSACYTGVYG